MTLEMDKPKILWDKCCQEDKYKSTDKCNCRNVIDNQNIMTEQKIKECCTELKLDPKCPKPDCMTIADKDCC